MVEIPADELDVIPALLPDRFIVKLAAAWVLSSTHVWTLLKYKESYDNRRETG